MKCWGWNSMGSLGTGSTSETELVPVDVVGLQSGVIAIATGTLHTCALTRKGGVMCWGQGWSGALGNGKPVNSSVPVIVPGLESGVVAIAAGTYSTCAITSAGAAACWGQNERGALGDGTTTKRLVPTPVWGLGSDVLSISTSGDHTCARTLSGGALCWGLNTGGQVGDGTTVDRLVPTPVVNFP